MTNWISIRNANNAPVVEGVYLLGNANSSIVYVGRADNLKERLLQHPDPSNPCLQRVGVAYFAYEQTTNSESREQELIRKYDPECNRA